MDETESYTLQEVIEKGFEAYHVAEDGVWWLFHGCCGLRSDPYRGVRTLIVEAGDIPKGPWRPTHWGEAELQRLESG